MKNPTAGTNKAQKPTYEIRFILQLQTWTT